MKKFIAILLAVLLCGGAISLAVSAATTGGSCGPNASYTFNTATGALNISGTGAIEWNVWEASPWENDKWLVKTLTIGSGITSIGERAFQNCYNLDTVSLPNSLLVIGDNAFALCMNLKSITIPPNVTTIGGWVFQGCHELTSITIPQKVNSIGRAVFSYCYSLSQINVSGNQFYKIVDGALLTADGTVLLAYPAARENASYSIPNTVKIIGSCAFTYATFSSITIPNSVETIERDAFWGCSRLESVNIPKSVTLIEEGAFNCVGPMTVDPENPNYSSQDGILYNNNKTILKQYPSRIRNYEDNYIMPNSVIEVERSAFTNIRTPVAVTISSGLSDFSFDTHGVSNLYVDSANPFFASEDGVLFSNNLKKLVKYPNARPDEAYSIPSGTMTIGERAFWGAHWLAKIEIPTTVKILEDQAISGVSDRFPSILVPAEVEEIGQWNFDGMRYIYLRDDGWWFPEQVMPIIYCHKNSVAHTDAINNGNPFILVNDSVKLGNDGDDVIVQYNNGSYSGNVILNVKDTVPQSAYTLVDNKLNPDQVKIFDIKTLLNNQPVQPLGKIIVKIKIPDGFDPIYAQVFYLDPDNWTATNMLARIEDGYAVFEADYFSLYAIVEVRQGGGPITPDPDPDPTPQKWWETIPAWLQFIFRYIFFGWIWMR
ncbi:MAG: leucine-rich repeat domain-containing protein [Oscillospiraceae bacterium]|nr:leucine-rich repeat domain-containing protein [Oscillospiraceae bacterium]